MAAAVAAGLATGAQAQTGPALGTSTFPGSMSSNATFTGGVTVSGGGFVNTVSANQTVNMQHSINVDSTDVGIEGDLYQVVRIVDGNSTTYYMRTPGGWTRWNAMIDFLVPFRTKLMAPIENISVSDLESALGLSLDGASIESHVGYMTGASALVYSQRDTTVIDSVDLGGTCPAATSFLAAVEAGGKDFCILSGTYTSDLHLTGEFDYVLSGAVFIGGDNVNTAELTIDAGTTFYAESGNDFLVINRGSQIHANGRPTAPITMTSANDATADSTVRGQWGGLIINGNAPINGCSAGTALCEAQGEGSTGLYGGNKPQDDSGNLNYLVVKYAGFEITPENELNGIAFQAVGSGTNVDYVQVHNNSDDGVEFFGGTVNAKHLVLTGNSDDSLDWVLGWQGKVQHVVIVQTDEGDQGFESDNLDTARDSLPRSHPTISNATLIGNANTDLGMLLREGTAGNFSNFVVAGFGDACIDIDHSATFANAGGSATSLTGELTMTNSIVDCGTNFDEEVDDNWSVQAWFTHQAGNQVGGASMTGYINSNVVNGMSATVPSDPFFDQVGHVGAVNSTSADWTSKWTFRDGWQQ